MTDVIVTDLSVKYDRENVLRDVTLRIRGDGISVLVGPSGSGKSTLLLAIAGLVRPHAGSIHIGDALVYQQSSHRDVLTENRGVGLVFQSHALWSHMTVSRNVAFPLRQQRPRLSNHEIHRRVTEMLELVDLPGYGDRYPDQLSGGQAQRVSLARGLVARPQVLLLDEPLSSIDARVRADLRMLIRRVQTEVGTTMLYVTHDREDAEILGDSITVMNDGEIVETGDAHDLLTAPQRTFTAEFLLDARTLGGESENNTFVVSEGKDCFPFVPAVRPASSGVNTATEGQRANGRFPQGRYGVTASSFVLSADPEGQGEVLAVVRSGGLQRVNVRMRSGLEVQCASLEEFKPGDRVTVGLREDRLFKLST